VLTTNSSTVTTISVVKREKTSEELKKGSSEMTGLHNEPGIYHFVALLLLIYLSLDWFGLQVEKLRSLSSGLLPVFSTLKKQYI
jgi:hypothetical protein